MTYKRLSYTDFPLNVAKQQYDKVLAALQRGDFWSTDVKKMPDTGFFRAKLDREARLLFQFIRHGGEVYVLLLEVLPHHEYDQSRFLRGAEIDEEKLAGLAAPAAEDVTAIRYLSPGGGPLHFLDKFISFDDDQKALLHLPAPLIISARRAAARPRTFVVTTSFSPWFVSSRTILLHMGTWFVRTRTTAA